MYETFFQLHTEPFRLSPDHQFCFRHAAFDRGSASVAEALAQGDRVLIVTGPPGTGKTTLAADLLESMRVDALTVAKVVSSRMGPDDLLLAAALAFGLTGLAGAGPAAVRRELLRFCSARLGEGASVVLVVDEAQGLTPEALVALAALAEPRSDRTPLLRVLLLGQPELLDVLEDPRLAGLRHRFAAVSALGPLSLAETRAYIRHRLAVGGWRGYPAISHALYPIIHRVAGGVPRRINLLCTRLLLEACAESRQRIGIEEARRVVAELQEEDLVPGMCLNDGVFEAADSFDELDLGGAAEPACPPSRHRSSVVNKRKCKALPGGLLRQQTRRPGRAGEPDTERARPVSAAGPATAAFAGAGGRQPQRWHRRGGRILLRTVMVAVIAVGGIL